MIKLSIPFFSKYYLYCVFVYEMHLPEHFRMDSQNTPSDILLPSNKEWRLKNYFKLVEQQRAMDSSP